MAERTLDENEKYLIAHWESTDNKIFIYLLNTGDWFRGFGGSSHGLQAKRTASLIVRSVGPMGLVDVEHDICDRQIWDSIFRAATAVRYAPRVL